MDTALAAIAPATVQLASARSRESRRGLAIIGTIISNRS